MDVIEDEVIEAARREIERPTFAVVEQILSVNTVVQKDGRPAAALVDLSTSPTIAFVFFHVENEP
ncbi:MAG: hypothetical protein M3Y56_03555 [Armatimonadota bacterium]|nr:hypothetical protein [Armatimonadota bacterium]